MTDTQTFQLHTARLLLKDLTVDDAEALFAYRHLPEVTKFQGWMPTAVSDAVTFIKEDICHVMNQPDTWFQLGIFIFPDKTLIGDVGIHFFPEVFKEAQKPEPTGIVEVGITVSPAHQGKGYASEAILRILEFLFEELHKNKVIASVDPENKKSMALMKKAGFRLDGIYPKAVLFRGEWTDDAVFEMTANQWLNQTKHSL
jgi:RimJ/RimL family protein N-acetyltransferase